MTYKQQSSDMVTLRAREERVQAMLAGGRPPPGSLGALLRVGLPSLDWSIRERHGLPLPREARPARPLCSSHVSMAAAAAHKAQSDMNADAGGQGVAARSREGSPVAWDFVPSALGTREQ